MIKNDLHTFRQLRALVSFGHIHSLDFSEDEDLADEIPTINAPYPFVGVLSIQLFDAFGNFVVLLNA